MEPLVRALTLMRVAHRKQKAQKRQADWEDWVWSACQGCAAAAFRFVNRTPGDPTDFVEMAETGEDQDFAGRERTRRSTSGGVVMLGNHCIKSYSQTQDTSLEIRSSTGS